MPTKPINIKKYVGLRPSYCTALEHDNCMPVVLRNGGEYMEQNSVFVIPIGRPDNCSFYHTHNLFNTLETSTTIKMLT